MRLVKYVKIVLGSHNGLKLFFVYKINLKFQKSILDIDKSQMLPTLVQLHIYSNLFYKCVCLYVTFHFYENM